MPPAIRRIPLRRGLLRPNRPYRSGAGGLENTEQGGAFSDLLQAVLGCHRPPPSMGPGTLTPAAVPLGEYVTRQTPTRANSPSQRPPLQAQLTAAGFEEKITTEIVAIAPSLLPKPITSNTWRGLAAGPYCLRPAQRSAAHGLFQASAFLLAPGVWEQYGLVVQHCGLAPALTPPIRL